jgi:hypothetical protein
MPVTTHLLVPDPADIREVRDPALDIRMMDIRMKDMRARAAQAHGRRAS